MKRLTITFAVLAIVANTVTGQIGIDNPAPDPKASLDIQATDKGLLVPRLTTGERIALGSGGTPESLLVYDTDLHTFFYYYNAEWYCLTPFDLKITTTVPKDAVMNTTLVNGVAINTTLNLGEKFAVGGSIRIDNDVKTSTLTASGNISTSSNVAATGNVTASNFSSAGTAGVAGPVPKGGIIMWSGSVASVPAGWALCNGSNGTPDLRDRFIVGAGSGYSVGSTGGETTHTLTINEMPGHSHTGTTNTTGNHYHDIPCTDMGNSYDYEDDGRHPANWAWGSATSWAGDHSHTINLNNTGGGAAHENRPPYYALAYIMKL